ncbi:glycosyl transferase [Flavobacterium akiainvivens]|uniref:Glycosyl transferase n=1 Tax=Flavobacterium akiainvivens TaxID=1202724 RepID=A0A0M8MLQ7_9FLAO|nr:glycosyl transferase [Flavobacterium akiainvivens]
MKFNTKKILRWGLISVATIVVLAVVGFFGFRNMVLQKVIAKVQHKMEADYNSTFTVKEAKFSGLNGISVKGITLVPKGADTLLNIQELNTSVSLGKIIFGNVQLGTLTMKNGYVQIVKKDSLGWNFRAFLKSPKKDEDSSDTERDYADRAYNIINKALNLIPTDMVLQNLALRVDDMGRKVNLNLSTLKLADEQLESSITVVEDSLTQHWKVKGLADPRGHKCDLKFFNTDTTRIMVPYISQRYNLKSGFKAIQLKVDGIEMDGGELHVDGFAAIENFMVNHPRVAQKDVVIDNARFDYHILFGGDFIALDSTSTVQLNKLKVHPFAKYSVEEDTIYQLKVNIPKTAAQDFIVSLPRGLFTNFEGMEAEGSFSYRLDFLYNKNKPSALVFDSSLQKDGLKITKYGEADLGKLNGTFTYRAMEDGRAQRAVLVGPENPNYTSFDQIPEAMRAAVLTSEDPSFFNHRGFITEAFRQSIIKNIKTKKFARGASTISMQLVKNVFLTREKTLSRKLEEILLVYILENNRIASKQRMLEVYFNVIEWGPDVYGIGEASHYYFEKAPMSLTLDECIYLASIIPSPKKFNWKFDTAGDLKPYAVKHNKYIRDLMLRRGLITPEDTLGQNGQVAITGPGRSRIKIDYENLFAADSIDMDEFFFDLGKKVY